MFEALPEVPELVAFAAEPVFEELELLVEEPVELPVLPAVWLLVLELADPAFDAVLLELVVLLAVMVFVEPCTVEATAVACSSAISAR